MPSERVSRQLANTVAARARWRCEYCRSPAGCSAQLFGVDHIIPRAKGGLTDEGNLALACACNSYKGDSMHGRDPETGRLAPLFHPRRQRWSRHFTWSADRTRIVGRTATGRATVESLRLNRPALVALRRMLAKAGEHPADRR